MFHAFCVYKSHSPNSTLKISKSAALLKAFHWLLPSIRQGHLPSAQWIKKLMLHLASPATSAYPSHFHPFNQYIQPHSPRFTGGVRAFVGTVPRAADGTVLSVHPAFPSRWSSSLGVSGPAATRDHRTTATDFTVE